MTLPEKIMTIYPDIDFDDLKIRRVILLQNNSDGRGDYIAKWEHPTHPKPTDEQLAALD